MSQYGVAPLFHPGTVHLFTRTRGIPRERLNLDDRFPVEHIRDRAAWPVRCDYYITFTGLTVKTERAAARMGALVVVLPEASNWFHGRVLTALTSGRDIWAFLAARDGDSP